MSSIPKEKLDKLIERWEVIQAELSQGVNQATYAKLTKEFSDLSPIVSAIQGLRAAEKEREDLVALIEDPSVGREMTSMAREELDALMPRIAGIDDQLKILLLPKEAADERSVILEVRAGTGGDEAALFAADLALRRAEGLEDGNHLAFRE